MAHRTTWEYCMDFEQAFAAVALAVLLPATAIGILWLTINGYA